MIGIGSRLTYIFSSSLFHEGEGEMGSWAMDRVAIFKDAIGICTLVRGITDRQRSSECGIPPLMHIKIRLMKAERKEWCSLHVSLAPLTPSGKCLLQIIRVQAQPWIRESLALSFCQFDV